MGGAVESPGFFARAWTVVKRAWCTLKCAWLEILQWVVVVILVVVSVMAVQYIIIFLAAEGFFTAPIGPAAWAVTIFLGIVAFILLAIYTYWLIEKVTVTHIQMKQKVWDCWMSC